MTTPSLLTKTRQTLEDIFAHYTENAAEISIAVGVSGGADSTALLHVLSRLRAKFGFKLVAIGVDHGLRKEAGAELAGIAQRAAEWDVPFEGVAVSLAGSDTGERGNVQARARNARMSALESARIRHGCAFVATAHHAEDRAETFLSRLLGGATAAGLAVLPARDRVRIRPFIRARKSEILAHLARNGIPYANDPSNLNERFERVRIRQELLPLLTRFNPNIVTHLGDLADELEGRQDAPRAEEPREAALRSLLSDLPGPHGKRVRNALRKLPEKAGGAEVALPGGLVARFDRTHTRYVVLERPSRPPKADRSRPVVKR